MIKDLYSFFLGKLRNALKIPALEEDIRECRQQLKQLNRVIRTSAIAVPPLIHPEHCNLICALSEQFISGEEQVSEQCPEALKDTTVTILDYEPEVWRKRLFINIANGPTITTVQIEDTNWMSLLQSLSTADYILIPSPFVIDILSLNANCFARLSQKAKKAVILATQHSDADGCNSIETSTSGDERLRKALHTNGFFQVTLLNPPSSIPSHSRHCVTQGFSFTDEQSLKNYSKGKSATILIPAETSTPLVYGANRL